MGSLAVVRRAALTAICLLLLTATAANAVTRYATPNPVGPDPSCTSENHPCSLADGVAASNGNDVLQLEAGTYTTPGNLAIASGVTLQGRTAGSTVVNGTNGSGVSVFKVGFSSAISNVRVSAPTAGALGVTLAFGATADRIDVRSDGTPCLITGTGVTLRDSLCVRTSTGATDEAVSISPDAGADHTTLRNDTIVAQGLGVRYHSQTTTGLTQGLDVVNTIVAPRALATACALYLEGPTGGTSHLQFTSTNSNHASVIQNVCTTNNVNAPTETNLQSAAPIFTNAAGGDYSEAANSPTRGAGVTDSANGPYDITFLPRSILGSTDIGAYQFATPPKTTADAPTAVTATSAVLHGTVNNHGLGSSTSFSYGINSTNENLPDAIDPPLAQSDADQPVQQVLSGLTPGTTYKWNVCTTSGTSFFVCGGPATFTTLPLVPGVSGSAVKGITTSGATVATTVNPGNGATIVYVDYGTTAALGKSTAIVNLAKGTGNVPVTLPVSGLKAATAYRAQVVASNAAGTTRGPVLSFTTAKTPPVPPPPPKLVFVGKPKQKHGTITATVNASAGKLKTKVTVKSGKRTITYAAKTTTVKKAGNVKLSLKPTKAAKKLLKKKKKLSVKLAVVLTPAKGAAKTVKATVKVKK
jgi:hypothetical protein